MELNERRAHVTILNFVKYPLKRRLRCDFGYICSQRHPLVKRAIVRVLIFFVYGLFIAWIFTFIEKRDEKVQEKIEKELKELRLEADLKYNMTDDDFNSFVKGAAEAMKGEIELDWTFLNSCVFVFAALTTVGKP